MKHYRIFSFILLFICAAFGQSCSISSSGREVLDMNTDWAFYRGDVVEGSRTDLDDSGWIPVALPHIMQLEMKHCGGNSIYDGIGWYRRYFKLPAKYKDKRIVVSFEGVMTNCDVYLNGQKVTEPIMKMCLWHFIRRMVLILCSAQKSRKNHIEVLFLISH